MVLTMNKYVKMEEYNLPHTEDLFAALSGVQAFIMSDLAKFIFAVTTDRKVEAVHDHQYT